MADSIEKAAGASARRTSALPWRTVGLVVGDAVSFLVFAGLGRNQHGEASGLGALGQIALTAVPFALGWFLVSPWVGVYRRQLTNTVRRMASRTELAWLASYPVALILRVLIAPDHQMPWTFALVILLANALLLGAWRSAFGFVERQVARSRA
ncbi:MAG TPA: DUF3054 domain-containing protein [Ktedonobacterales bacterium]|nr:DUF3054 domain-containing protein [Ktedonobacterales bacterium]